VNFEHKSANIVNLALVYIETIARS